MKAINFFIYPIFFSIFFLFFISCNKDSSPDNHVENGNISKVFLPEELLSASEATELTGFEVSIDENSLSKDSQLGIISERYIYDINESNTEHALIQIEENGFKQADAVKNGSTALHSFESEMNFSKDEISIVNGLGDQAFTFNNTGQLHMLYKDYYIISAFDADAYTTDKNAQLNINLGRRILTNLKEKL